MKSRGFDLSIGRTTVTLFCAVKFLILSSLVGLFLNVTLSLYSSVSTRYYSIKQPIFKISSSSSSYSSSSSSYHLNSILFPIYQSDSHALQGSSTSPHPTNPSHDSNSISSLLLLQSPPSILNQSSISSPLPSTFSSLNSIDHFHSLSASNNLDNSSIPYKIYPLTLIQNSSFFSNSSFSSPDYYLNSSITISLNPEKPIVRMRLLPKGCDPSKGEWVEDPNAPYYRNSTCWMIQEHQNCIKYGRPNLDFLKWRWKPDGCELPILDPAQFLELMRGKNFAFIGDSLGRNQMQSLMCLLSRVEYPKEISSSYENLTCMFYQNYNFTIWFFWSPFLVRAEQSNHTMYNFPSWNLYLDEPDPLWPSHLPKFDYVVLNTGNWYTRSAFFHLNHILVGCHYCPIPNAPFMSMRRAHRHAFRTALNSITFANQHGFKGVTIVLTISPSHFEGGDWNKGGDCVRTKPFRGKEAPRLEGLEKDMYKEQLKEFWRAKWEGSEIGLEFRLMDITKAMLMRPDGHPSKYGHFANEILVMHNDCVHWCLPGPVDMWNNFLFQIINICRV